MFGYWSISNVARIIGVTAVALLLGACAATPTTTASTTETAPTVGAEVSQTKDPLSLVVEEVQTQAKAVIQSITQAEQTAAEAQHNQSSSQETLAPARPKEVGVLTLKAQSANSRPSEKGKALQQSQTEAAVIENVSATQSTQSTQTSQSSSKVAPVTKNASEIAFLLGEAGWAFKQDKLTTPEKQSAYFYLSKVLAKDPNNAEALAGLEKIMQRYFQLLQLSLNKGKVDQARVFWLRAKQVNPKHEQLPSMRKVIDDAQSASQDRLASSTQVANKTAPKTASPALRTQVLLVQETALKNKDEALASWLIAMATKAQSLNATMLIVAPTDGQARWVYQMMNSADPERRIRANIKRARPARVEVSYISSEDELEVYAQ